MGGLTGVFACMLHHMNYVMLWFCSCAFCARSVVEPRWPSRGGQDFLLFGLVDLQRVSLVFVVGLPEANLTPRLRAQGK